MKTNIYIQILFFYYILLNYSFIIFIDIKIYKFSILVKFIITLNTIFLIPLKLNIEKIKNII